LTPPTCAEVTRHLPLYHDRELPIDRQIAFATHLGWCRDCAAAAGELQTIGAAIRAAVDRPGMLSPDDSAAFNAAVVNRLQAEHAASMWVQMQLLFDDMHLVYVGLGAAAATIASVIVMLGMMAFATSARPDSLAAIVHYLATPGSNQNPVAADERMLLPRALDSSFSTGKPAPQNNGVEADAVFTLAAVVTREGRIANLELLHATGGNSEADEAKLVEALLDAVSRARFEPARMAGLPVAVNMVWLVASTTVHGAKNAPADVPVLPVKKPGAQRPGAST
jgi:hypothetical protein